MSLSPHRHGFIVLHCTLLVSHWRSFLIGRKGKLLSLATWKESGYSIIFFSIVLLSIIFFSIVLFSIQHHPAQATQRVVVSTWAQESPERVASISIQDATTIVTLYFRKVKRQSV